MKSPRVSVCITTYNHERYIHDCIMSVVAQAHDIPLEILVGDDRSSDKTGEIVRRLADRFPDIVRYFIHENRMGGEWNYQFLIGKATGEYIAHLDGDDYWLPGKIVKQISLMDEFPEIMASYTNALCIDDGGTAIGVFNNRQPSKFDIDYLLRMSNFLNNSSMVYRHDFKGEICGWLPDFVDYKIHLKLASRGKIGFLNILGVGYRVNSHTSMIVNHGERVRELYWQAINEISTDIVQSNCKLSASADFLRRICFRSVKVRSLDLLKKWWPIVSTAHREQKVMLALRVIRGTAITTYRELVTRIAASFGGTQLRVIYWR